jgi:predicted ATPase
MATLPAMADNWLTDRRSVRRVVPNGYAENRWPAHVPAVAQLLDEGLELGEGVTLLVGENGTGKSTLVEAVAMAFGLSPEGGSTQARHSTRESESHLWRWIRLERAAGASPWGFFLRAETMHGFYSYLEANPGGYDPDFHQLSHGESFLEILRTRFDSPGLYCLDEPEAALSFTGQIALVATMHEMGQGGAQFLCATHSPLLAALPGATILEVGPWGLRNTTYDQLELVEHWKAYLAEPMRYLRHVL